MADYKQLKTITIDGVTMGMEEGLGINNTSSNTRTGAVAVNTEYAGVSMSVEEGAYIVRARVAFPAPSSTGAVRRDVFIYAGDTRLAATSMEYGHPSPAAKEAVCVASVSSATTIQVKFSTSKALPANAGLSTQIWVTQILRVPTT